MQKIIPFSSTLTRKIGGSLKKKTLPKLLIDSDFALQHPVTRSITGTRTNTYQLTCMYSLKHILEFVELC